MGRSVRGWVVAMAGLAWGLGSAQAATHCEPGARPGVERCVSGLDREEVAAMAQTQRASQWCWAASISMVLRSYGVDVPQEQVVRAYFGAAADVPVPGEAITDLLNRTWRDGAGRSAVLAADSMGPREARLSSPEVLGDMDEGRPVVLVLPRHAVVLVQVEYERNIGGQGEPRILQATVLDPRMNQPRTMQPTAAIVHVTRAMGESGDSVAGATQVAARATVR